MKEKKIVFYILQYSDLVWLFEDIGTICRISYICVFLSLFLASIFVCFAISVIRNFKICIRDQTCD